MTDILDEVLGNADAKNMHKNAIVAATYRPIQNDTSIELYTPLTIDPDTFWNNYNLDIEDFVERHKAKEDAQSKGGANQLKKDILYLSYSHAFRLFRTNHPGWEVDCAVNPRTGGYLFEELDRRGYFIKSYIHDGRKRSAAYYNGILTMSGQGINPDDVKSDYKSGTPKKSPIGDYIYTVDSQLINKAVYRAMVKAIALFTGIGLKLWTGDDLSQDVLDAKMTLITNVQKLSQNYTALTGKTFPEVDTLSYMSDEGEIKRIGRNLQLALNEAKSASELVSK